MSIEQKASFTLQTGERIYYQGLPNFTDPPVILLHGLSQQSRYWELVEREVQRPCIAVDLRGHGDSQDFGPESNFSVERVAQDVIELMDHLQLASAHIVGHSWGASIALRIAVSAPQRILSCALIDGGAFNPNDLIPNIVSSAAELRELLTPPTGPFSQEMLANHYRELGGTDSSQVMAAVSETYTGSETGGFVTKIGFARHMKVLDGLLGYHHIRDIRNIRVPTWVVNCRSDDFWDIAKSDSIPMLLNNHLIHVQNWYGCVHDVPLQRPLAVAELISTIATLTDD